MQLELTSIRTDGGTQPRATYHYGAVDSYAEDMETGAAFPPVVVFYDGADYWLADGFHRVLAAKKIERAAIEADVRQGTQQDAQWYSYSVNQTHGLRRSNEDKKRAVEAALAHPRAGGMTDEAIADHCGVTQQMVNEYRNRVTYKNSKSTENGYRTGKDGVKRKVPSKKQPPAPKPEPEDDEPLDPYEEQIAAQYQNGATAPINEPTSIGEARLVEKANALVIELNYGDLRRLVELLAERIAVEA